MTNIKQNKINTAYNMDCLEAMKGMKDNEFDLAIVDPPYGINAEKFNLRTDCHKRLKSKWVDEKPNNYYFQELKRIAVNYIIWGGNYFTDVLEPNNNWIVWYKNNDGVSFSMCELAYTNIRKNIKLFDYRPMGKLNKIHPTQKPVALYKWLLTNYAKQGDKILDTHLGSGSSRIACYDLGFDFVGYELDKDYFEAQEKRFERHINQQGMF